MDKNVRYLTSFQGGFILQNSKKTNLAIMDTEIAVAMVSAINDKLKQMNIIENDLTETFTINDILSYVEFGYKKCEEGLNLQATIAEAKYYLKGK